MRPTVRFIRDNLLKRVYKIELFSRIRPPHPTNTDNSVEPI